MKHLHTYKSSFFSGILSAFDIGGTIQNDVAPLSEGFEYDMQQLLEDQQALIHDQQKSKEKLIRELSNR